MAAARPMSGGPRIFGAFSVFKESGGMQVKPIPPKFKASGGTGGASVLSLAKQVFFCVVPTSCRHTCLHPPLPTCAMHPCE